MGQLYRAEPRQSQGVKTQPRLDDLFRMLHQYFNEAFALRRVSVEYVGEVDGRVRRSCSLNNVNAQVAWKSLTDSFRKKGIDGCGCTLVLPAVAVQA